jgi:hypothetical protein
MIRRLWSVAFLFALLAPSRARAQTAGLVTDAQRAYDELEFGRAITLATRATGERMSQPDLLAAWRILGFAYASLDSTRQAREAFKQALFLDPDWMLDESRISPKITSLHALALREVLVVRHPALDSAEFVVGAGGVDLRFTVTRTARVRVRIVSPGGSAVIDSVQGEGQLRLRWDGRLAGDSIPTGGRHTIVIEAVAGRDTYARSLGVEIRPAAVDTTTHINSLPGYDLLPEQVTPPRSWRPLGLALITSAVTGGAALALESGKLGGGPHRELAGVSVASIGIGILAMLRKPAPVPSEANIRYNRIVQDNIARENGRIAADNEGRRRQVRLRIVPAPAAVAGDGSQ